MVRIIVGLLITGLATFVLIMGFLKFRGSHKIVETPVSSAPAATADETAEATSEDLGKLISILHEQMTKVNTIGDDVIEANLTNVVERDISKNIRTLSKSDAVKQSDELLRQQEVKDAAAEMGGKVLHKYYGD